MENCENCGAQLTGRYCASCGEDNDTPRLSMKSMMGEFFGSFLSYDSGFNTTVRLLLIRPEEIIKNYVRGIRSPYYNPIRLAIIFATLNAIIVVQLNLFESYGLAVTGTEEQEFANRYVMDLMTRYMNFMSVGIIPFLALFNWLFYRHLKWNYAEHLLTATYLYTFVLILGVATTPFQIFFKESFTLNIVVGLGVSVSYLVYASVRVLERDIAGAIKALLSYVLSYFLFILFVILLIGIKMIVDFKTGGLPIPTPEDKLHGYWELQAMEKEDTLSGGWVPYRPGGVEGTLMYDNDGHVSLHLQSIDYFYTGTYKLANDSVVEHTRLTHSDSSQIGVTVRRWFAFSGDTLVIRPVEEQNASLRLKWLKREE